MSTSPKKSSRSPAVSVGQASSRKVSTILKKRLKELKAIKDEDIDYSDIPELKDDFWSEAVLMPPLGERH